MRAVRYPKLPNEILDEATEWFVQLGTGAVSSQQRREFVAWLRQSPEHIRSYLQISAHWEDADVLVNERTPSVAELVAIARADRENVIPLDSGQAIPEGSARRLSSDKKRVGWRALAAAIFPMVLGVSYWIASQRSTYSTDTGETRSLTLSDGTTIDLNARSTVRIALEQRQRQVYLERGQALFHVAKDPARPFVVHALDTEVLVLGTQFDVNRKENRTVVTVIEGEVAVASTHNASDLDSSTSAMLVDKTGADASVLHPRKSSKRMRLGAGDQATVTERGAANSQHLADPGVATAWTHKQVVFQDTPLSEVVTEFNRYYSKHFVIVDASIESTHISGVFSTSSPASLIRGLQSLGKFKVVETSERVEISAQ